MKTIIKNNVTVKKKGNTYTLSDKKTGKMLHRIVDDPIYSAFRMKRPFLSGMGSTINVVGNYYSFKKYLLKNSDYKALASDWRKVGIYFIEALSFYEGK